MIPPGAGFGNKQSVGWWTVALVLASAAAAVLSMVWLSTVTAYTPQGETHCGRALQELPNLVVDVVGRCHLARQARLWLGFQAAGAALAAGLAVGVAIVLAQRRR
jgi:hypothetical protein